MNPGRISSSSIPFSLILRFSPGATESVSTSSERIPRTSTLCLKETKIGKLLIHSLHYRMENDLFAEDLQVTFFCGC